MDVDEFDKCVDIFDKAYDVVHNKVNIAVNEFKVMKKAIELNKEIKDNNKEIGILIYNELIERFYNGQEIKLIVDKYKLHKKDIGLLFAGPVIPLGPVILGYKLIRAAFDNNLNVDEYYKKFIKICDNQGLRDKLLNDDKYVPNDDELIELMKVYKRRNNIDLIEILHCKCGQINVKYKNN